MSYLSRRCGLVGAVACLLLSGVPAAVGKDAWVEVQSPNFTVISNAGEKEARKIAYQFEQFRELFHSDFPKLRVDLGKPLIIFAVKNEESLKQLLPGFWEVKGRVHPGGVYEPGEERHFVALRTDFGGQNPYLVVYHEYTHAILNLNFRDLPVWMGEGLAEFFGNSTIRENYAEVGKVAPYHLWVLRQSRFIPIDELLQVDEQSPYYNEENRASIFYAESWAMVHYLLMDPEARKRGLLFHFLAAWDASGNQVEAAQQTFGDLKKFSKAMEGYARQQVFYVGKVNTPVRGDPKSYASRELTPGELAAERALFYIHTRRPEEAKAAAEEALKAEPNLPLAYEAKGLIAYLGGDFNAADEAFSRAMELHSTSYFVYYFATQARLRQGARGPGDTEEIAAMLEKTISMNPQFAPAYAALASFYSMSPERQQKALEAGKKAMQLEPGNLQYAINYGYVLLNMGKSDEAKALAARIKQAAKTPAERGESQNLLQAVASRESYDRAMAEAAERAKQAQEEPTASKNVENNSPPEKEEKAETWVSEVSKKHAGEQQYAAEGTIQSAECNTAVRGTVTLRAGNSTLKLFYANLAGLYVVSTAKGDAGTSPGCPAWKGRRARLYFYKTKEKPYTGELDTIQFF